MDLDISVIWKEIEDLRRAGYSSWLVGGAVRDLLKGERPRDVDLLVDAGEDIISGLFPGAKRMGKGKQVSWLLPMGEANLELTCLCGRTLEEDLERRDFTINAMAMASDGTVTDPFDGRRDLEQGILRFTGDPAIRLSEDPVRSLRFCRFASLYNMFPDPASCAAIRELSPFLPGAHRQRVGREILISAQKGCLSRFLSLADDLHLTRVYHFFPASQEPGFNLVLKGQPPLDALTCLEELEKKGSHPRCSLGLFFLNGPGTFPAENVMDFLHGYAWPRDLVKGILRLCRFAVPLVSSPTEGLIFEMMEETEPPERRDIFMLASVILAQGGKDLRPLMAGKKLLYRMEENLRSPGLLLGGREIMELCRLSPGREVGRIRRKIRFLVASGQISSREEAIREIQVPPYL